MAMLNLEEPTCIEFTKFLLTKGADVNLGDVGNVTPLHILAAYKPTADNNLDGKAKLA
jgi:ankyrin repeat protein